MGLAVVGQPNFELRYPVSKARMALGLSLRKCFSLLSHSWSFQSFTHKYRYDGPIQ